MFDKIAKSLANATVMAFEKLKAAGGEYALFAVEDTGYEKIQINFTDIRNKLAEQRQLLLAYKEYYESEEPKVTE